MPVFLEPMERFVNIVEHIAAAHVHDKRHVGNPFVLTRAKLGEHGDQFRRQVVHAEKVHIFKAAERRASTRPGKPRHDDNSHSRYPSCKRLTILSRGTPASMAAS